MFQPQIANLIDQTDEIHLDGKSIKVKRSSISKVIEIRLGIQEKSDRLEKLERTLANFNYQVSEVEDSIKNMDYPNSTCNESIKNQFRYLEKRLAIVSGSARSIYTNFEKLIPKKYGPVSQFYEFNLNHDGRGLEY